MSDVTALENSLFDEWQTLSPNMVRDGAVMPDTYLESSPRILLILKEVNDPDSGGWDLRDYLRKGGRPQTWTNVTRWLEGIRALPRELTWSEIKTIDADARKKALASIAVMNLKKEPGGHTSIGAQIAKAATDRTELLRRQFALYEPDLVICCGTASMAKKALMPQVQARWQHTSRGVHYLEIASGRFMIDYAHPAARCASPLLVYGLVDAIREIWAEN